MGAPKGNKFWQARSSHGRKPIFETPDVLWEACLEYFNWVEENPLTEEKLFHYQGAIVRDTVAKMRAMTVKGLCIFLDIDTSTWEDYTKRQDFIRVTTRAREIIDSQKFEGAAAELLSANIIARDLGLADKSELTGKDGEPVKTESTWIVQPVSPVDATKTQG